eukprot:GDKI01013898.1.p1 GENE.GDKI01013898.1~~GDKI01013898.1.p1  ORF type:complete len:264 (-),score=56.09 GDKI01013898.1:216-1007(-)
MKLLSILCGIAVLGLASAGSGVSKHANIRKHNDKHNKINVALYYESLCPFCVRFISNTLKPVYDDETLRQYVNFQMIPSGNAKVGEDGDGAKTVFCQHGEAECLGNKMHVCTMEYFQQESDKFMPYLFCYDGALNSKQAHSIQDAFKQCTGDHAELHEFVKTCANGDQGTQLLLKATAATNELSPPHEHVPWVTIDGKHAPDAEEGGLKEVVCSSLGNSVAPLSCLATNIDTTLLKSGTSSKRNFSPNESLESIKNREYSEEQ